MAFVAELAQRLHGAAGESDPLEASMLITSCIAEAVNELEAVAEDQSESHTE